MSLRAKLAPCSIVIVLAAALAASAETSTAPAPEADPGRQMDDYLRRATARRDFNGTVLVVRDGRILLRRGYGPADVSRGIRNAPGTRFRISSLTSEITDVALLQLVERGRLGLGDSLCGHLRPCPRAWQPITVRLLLTARSGLPSARPLPDAALSVPQWLRRLRSRPLSFPAGRGRDRSEARLLVTAYLVAVVGRTSWLEYITRNVLRPAGMTATAADRPDLPRRAVPYVRTRDGRLGPPARFAALSRPDVVYGLASTVDDMYRFDVARRSGRLVSRSLLEEVSRETNSDGPDSFAHLGHGPRGTSDGWYTAFARNGDERVTILAFSNMGGYLLSDVVHRLLLLAIGWPPPRGVVDPAVVDRYTGSYSRWDAAKRRRATTVVRARADGTLALTSDEPAHPRSANRALRGARWQWTLVPTSDGTFYASVAGEDPGVRVALERADDRADDVLVVKFVSFGGGHRYRRRA